MKLGFYYPNAKLRCWDVTSFCRQYPRSHRVSDRDRDSEGEGIGIWEGKSS